MNQQINLYQPIFREERKLFSLKTVSLGLGIVAVALVGMWALAAHNVGKLEKAVAQLQAQQLAQEDMARSAGVLLDAQGGPANIQAQVQVLSTQLADRTTALNLLRSGAAGEPRGFGPRLQALARQHTEGVWLDELLLGGGPNGLVLRGRSLNPELVPRYLQLLASEPELAGARFDQVVIDRREHHDPKAPLKADTDKKGQTDAAPTVRFSVSSSALLDAEEQGS
jgi:hypothetical protein